MTPFEIYRTYLALKAHFKSENNYDFFKYNGRVKANQQSFDNCKFKYKCMKLERNYGDHFVDFAVANFKKGNGLKWIGELTNPVADDYYLEHKSYYEGFNYNFQKDMDEILQHGHLHALRILGENIPSAFSLLYRNEVALDTLACVCKIYPQVSGYWIEGFQEMENPTLLDTAIFIKNYTPFIKKDREKIKKIFDECIENQK